MTDTIKANLKYDVPFYFFKDIFSNTYFLKSTFKIKKWLFNDI